MCNKGGGGLLYTCSTSVPFDDSKRIRRRANSAQGEFGAGENLVNSAHKRSEFGAKKKTGEFGALNNSLSFAMSNQMLFNVIQRRYKQKKLRLPLLLKALEYNKDLLPFQSSKVKKISLIFGNRIALKFWLLTLRYI